MTEKRASLRGSNAEIADVRRALGAAASISVARSLPRGHSGVCVQQRIVTAVYEVLGDHEHMVDIESGKVLEFQDSELIEKLNKIAEDAGYELVDHNLVLHVKKLD